MKKPLLTTLVIFLAAIYTVSADGITVSLETSLSGGTHLTGFDSRNVKIQPSIYPELGVNVNFGNSFSAGIISAFRYCGASSLDGGWAYPGFNGIEAGISLNAKLPSLPLLGLWLDGRAGWYTYVHTENKFFLPSVSAGPSFMLFDMKYFDLYAELPVTLYFHRQADIFMSAGLRLRTSIK